MRLNTLKKNKEFRFIHVRGNSFVTKNLVLLCVKRKSGGVRPGFSISKKIGGAVCRNRLRRQLKAAFCDILKIYHVGNYGLIFIARQNITRVTYQDIAKDMLFLMRKATILGEKLNHEEVIFVDHQVL